MVELGDITGHESLKAWLEDQPHEVAVWIASRAAARVLPNWWDAVLSKEWARGRDLTALPVLRCILISSVAAKLPTRQIRTAAALAAAAAADDATTTDSRYPSAYAAPAAAVTAADAAADAAANTSAPAYGVHGAPAAIATAAAAVAVGVLEAFRADAEFVASGESPDVLTLWSDGAGPLTETWDKVKTQVAKAPDAQDWKFWSEWYDALLEGRPMLGDAGRTWEMLEKIALIDPETWDRGPEAVNPLIREIWELHRLRAEVAALHAEKEAWLSARASQAHRGHNQPPEGLVDDAPEVAQEITIIWDNLDAARAALEVDSPDKGLLRAIAERMLEALKAVVAYCGNVADAVVMSAAKVGGSAVGTALLDHVVNNGRLMQFAKDLLRFGGGG